MNEKFKEYLTLILAVLYIFGGFAIIKFYPEESCSCNPIIKTEIATTTEYINTCYGEIEYKYITVWDKIDECEKEDGNFYLYKRFNGGYTYYCEVDKEIMRGSVDVRDLKED